MQLIGRICGACTSRRLKVVDRGVPQTCLQRRCLASSNFWNAFPLKLTIEIGDGHHVEGARGNTDGFHSAIHGRATTINAPLACHNETAAVTSNLNSTISDVEDVRLQTKFHIYSTIGTRTLLGAPGLTTRSKGIATSGSWHRYERSKDAYY